MGFSIIAFIAMLGLVRGIGKRDKTWRGRMNMANKIVREELKSRGVRHWELAHELGVSEQTLVRWLRFELDEDRQLDMLTKVETIAKRKETAFDD